MGKKVDIANVLEVSPGASGEYTIYKVQELRTLTCSKVKLYFPVGTGFDLRIRIRWGNITIRPTEGFYSGDGNWVIAETDDKYPANTEIVLVYENTNPNETKWVFYHFEGELE